MSPGYNHGGLKLNTICLRDSLYVYLKHPKHDVEKLLLLIPPVGASQNSVLASTINTTWLREQRLNAHRQPF